MIVMKSLQSPEAGCPSRFDDIKGRSKRRRPAEAEITYITFIPLSKTHSTRIPTAELLNLTARSRCCFWQRPVPYMRPIAIKREVVPPETSPPSSPGIWQYQPIDRAEHAEAIRRYDSGPAHNPFLLPRRLEPGVDLIFATWQGRASIVQSPI
jgi:hypothetical protein